MAERDYKRQIDRIGAEVSRLGVLLQSVSQLEERIFLKAEIVHLRALALRLADKRHRKPPEAGIAVPAVPPEGPLPKTGGAEAPLEFD